MLRRMATVLIGCMAIAAARQAAGGSPAAEMQVILLGTGYPIPDARRAGPANAIVVNDKLFLVDAGRGVTMRLAAAGYKASDVRAVFLTHIHSDHTVGLPDVFNTGWIQRRAHPLPLYGPPGIEHLAAGALEFFKDDIVIRRDQVESLAPEGATFDLHVVTEGVAFQDADVKVTAFLVDHGPVKPAYGYKFESGGKTIVFSGDTRPSENLVKYAQGADVLIHEVYAPGYFEAHNPPDVAARLKYYHTSADEVGEIARKAGVKLLVLSHLVPGNEERQMLELAATRFKGKIAVGKDLDRF